MIPRKARKVVLRSWIRRKFSDSRRFHTAYYIYFIYIYIYVYIKHQNAFRGGYNESSARDVAKIERG